MSRVGPGTEPAAPAGGGGGEPSDGDKGDVQVLSGVWLVKNGIISTNKLGGDITTAGKALLDDADAAAQRTTLGLGTAATVNSTAFASNIHTHDAADVGIEDPGWSGNLLGSGVKDPQQLADYVDGLSLGGGSDPWTIVVLGSDFTTSTTANSNVTGLAFAPSASKTYLVRLYLLVSTSAATTGPRPGIAWPTGLTTAGSYIQTPNSNTAAAFRFQGAISTQNAASTGLPTTADSYLAIGEAVMVVGGSPSGNFQVTLASEVAASNVTMKTGSFLMYREIS